MQHQPGEHFLLPSADKLSLAPAHRAKTAAKWFANRIITALEWPANSPDLKNTEKLWVIHKRQTRNTRV